MRRKRAALVRRSTACWELAAGTRASAAGLRRNTPSIRQGRYARPARNLRATCRPYAVLDPGLCLQGFEWHSLHREPADEPFPTDGCQWARGWLLHSVCEVIGRW